MKEIPMNGSLVEDYEKNHKDVIVKRIKSRRCEEP
jgi:hypothetical protein